MVQLLLVTDAAWIRNDVAAAITDASTVLVTVDFPEQALETAIERHFDAVIIDMQVRSMGGMAVVRLFKDAIANEELTRVPLILLLDRTADVFLAKRAGADAHLVKPFTSQDLRATLGAFLPA